MWMVIKLGIDFLGQMFYLNILLWGLQYIYPTKDLYPE